MDTHRVEPWSDFSTDGWQVVLFPGPNSTRRFTATSPTGVAATVAADGSLTFTIDNERRGYVAPGQWAYVHKLAAPEDDVAVATPTEQTRGGSSEQDGGSS